MRAHVGYVMNRSINQNAATNPITPTIVSARAPFLLACTQTNATARKTT